MCAKGRPEDNNPLVFHLVRIYLTEITAMHLPYGMKPMEGALNSFVKRFCGSVYPQSIENMPMLIRAL